jgi:hypothetical protein
MAGWIQSYRIHYTESLATPPHGKFRYVKTEDKQIFGSRMGDPQPLISALGRILLILSNTGLVNLSAQYLSLQNKGMFSVR